jgi:hypothetical protein
MGEPDWEFVESGGYYRLEYPGPDTVDAFERLFRDAVAHSSRTGVNRYLVDMRTVEVTLSFLEKFELAEDIASVFGPRFRISILFTNSLDREKAEEITRKTEFFENVAVNRGGVGIRMMDDEAAAIRWVST